MKQYLSITKEIRRNIPIYAFDKLDGSNIRAEWSRKNGFYKFGSRKVLIDKSHPMGEAEKLIKEKYEDDLSKIFVKNKMDKVVCFFEYYGDNSFAGQHIDEEHTVTLLDINVYKKGILPPVDFLKMVGDLDIPSVLYYGNANKDLELSVKSSSLEGMTFEGIVCKAKNPKRTPLPLMFKIKSDAWHKALHEYCAGNNELYATLS